MSPPTKKLTEKEIEHRIAQVVETQVAKGIIITEQNEQDLRDYLNGDMPFDEVAQEVETALARLEARLKELQKPYPRAIQSPHKQYIIPCDDADGSNLIDMLEHIDNFENMSWHLQNGNIETYKRFFQKLYAKYKIFLHRWLRQNWNTLDKERQDFAKPFYHKGSMLL